jgi:hypothetical protein
MRLCRWWTTSELQAPRAVGIRARYGVLPYLGATRPAPEPASKPVSRNSCRVASSGGCALPVCWLRSALPYPLNADGHLPYLPAMRSQRFGGIGQRGVRPGQ